MRKILPFLLILLLVLSSCATKTGTVESCQTIYHTEIRLRPEELTDGMVSYFHLPEVANSGRHACRVEMSDGEVRIGRAGTYDSTFVRQFDYGYFAGVDLGEWDGWVRYYPYHTNLLDADPELVANENCRGIVACEDRSRGYVITGNLMEDSGKLYELVLAESETVWEWHLIGALEGFPYSYSYRDDESGLLIATSKEIVSVSADQQIRTLFRSEYLKLEPSSILLCEDQIWCGLYAGLLRVDLSTLEQTWYWLDWDE